MDFVENELQYHQQNCVCIKELKLRCKVNDARKGIFCASDTAFFGFCLQGHIRQSSIVRDIAPLRSHCIEPQYTSRHHHGGDDVQLRAPAL